jgi:prevent-host-death family protein
MEITAKELRGKPGQIIEQAARGTDVIITMRGKRLARLIPYKSKNTGVDTQENDDIIFGLWKEREGEISVDAYVREMRKRRSL